MVRGKVSLWTAVLALGLGAALLPARVEAQRTAYVEGNNASNAGPGNTAVPPGTAGDFDGDGRVGLVEDTDNAVDGIFGTLNGALGAANGGIDLNGRVVILSTGRFAEQISLAGIKGDVILEAAPGVDATVEAVLGVDPGNFTRLAGAGITVDVGAEDRLVVLRNLTIRNFAVGLWIKNRSHVVCENCRFDGNLSANVLVQDAAVLTMNESTVVAGGRRFTPARNTPDPGDGLAFVGNATGSISHTTIAGNAGAGIRQNSARRVRLISGNNIADNGADTAGTGAGFEGSPFDFLPTAFPTKK